MYVKLLYMYRRLCELHLPVCTLATRWPREKLYELGSQVRRSSNSAPAQLAEKNDNRHIRNKVEGVNCVQGEKKLAQILRSSDQRWNVIKGFSNEYHICDELIDFQLPDTLSHA